MSKCLISGGETEAFISIGKMRIADGFLEAKDCPDEPFFAANPPEYSLLFAWNHAEETLAKEQRYRESGGRFVLYVPKVHTP